MRIVKTAVIGAGYFGKFHAEKYHRLPQAELVAIADVNLANAQAIAQKYNAQAYTDYRELVGKVEAVSIAAPTSQHYEIAKFFLENNIHVLVEKPIATTVTEARSMIAIAKEKHRVLQVGHLERFNNVFLAIKHIVEKPSYVESLRLAPFKPRCNDVNVILDLMIHDIDMIQNVIQDDIKNIYANGTSVLTDEIDIANARIEFENGCVANVTASRNSLQVARKLRVFQHEKYLSIDLQNKKISYHHKGESAFFPGVPELVHEEQTFEHGDALLDEIASFLDCVINNKRPIVTGEDGKRALDTANKITQIITNQSAVKDVEFA